MSWMAAALPSLDAEPVPFTPKPVLLAQADPLQNMEIRTKPMSASHAFFADESGNAWINYLDDGQLFHVTAGFLIAAAHRAETEAEECSGLDISALRCGGQVCGGDKRLLIIDQDALGVQACGVLGCVNILLR